METIKRYVHGLAEAYEEQPQLVREAEVAAASSGFYFLLDYVANLQADPHVVGAVFAVGLARVVLRALTRFVPKPG